MGAGQVYPSEKNATTPPESDTGDGSDTIQFTQTLTEEENETEKREIFMKLMKPRVRYDVEVVTKLIVYTGKSGTDELKYGRKLIEPQALHGWQSKAILFYSNL